jgi:hypothetical protein
MMIGKMWMEYYKNGLTDLLENIHPTYDIFILNVERCGTKS